MVTFPKHAEYFTDTGIIIKTVTSPVCGIVSFIAFLECPNFERKDMVDAAMKTGKLSSTNKKLQDQLLKRGSNRSINQKADSHCLMCFASFQFIESTVLRKARSSS